ncbi:MAG: hypothetical protein U9O94_06355 [Nanoarchaeota archaeon]|nr:hypothetical protein [Nanoarchaeota archaeon]
MDYEQILLQLQSIADGSKIGSNYFLLFIERMEKKAFTKRNTKYVIHQIDRYIEELYVDIANLMTQKEKLNAKS